MNSVILLGLIALSVSYMLIVTDKVGYSAATVLLFEKNKKRFYYLDGLLMRGVAYCRRQKKLGQPLDSYTYITQNADKVVYSFTQDDKNNSVCIEMLVYGPNNSIAKAQAKIIFVQDKHIIQLWSLNN